MRYFVLRGFKYKGQLIEAGSLLNQEVVDKIFPERSRFAIRRLLIIDTEFEYDLNPKERSTHIKRLKILSQMEGEEAKIISGAIEQVLAEKIGAKKASGIISKGLKSIKKKAETKDKSNEEAKAEAEAKVKKKKASKKKVAKQKDD